MPASSVPSSISLLALVAALAAPAAAQGPLAPAPPARDDLPALSDEFSSPAPLAGWKRFHQVEGWPSKERRVEVDAAAGELRIEPTTSGWYADFQAPFLFRDVSGDFTVTARVRADALRGGIPCAGWSLGGLMVRAPRAVTPATWTPGGEDWLFVTTGVADDVTQPVIETKTTVRSISRLRLHPVDAGWVELRIARSGAWFELSSRSEGGEWAVRDRFERPDLPETVQVGLNAYTDWYSASALHADPLRFNTTLVGNGNPDLTLRVDWIRFERPER